ncbi:MAG: hypothetical protein NW216_06460 [Hyphomicrobium sp.]|nr:hypothetical protein [Hyphomicrobium sp.]
MLAIIGRLILVPLGFALAAAVSLGVALMLGLEKMTAAMAGREGGFTTIEAYIELARSGTALLAGLTILPALAVVIVGEVARIRSWLYYMLGGGVALGILPILARYGAPDMLAAPPAALWQVLATAGFAGGLVYWLVAGRNA